MGGPLRSEGKDICFPLVPANSSSPDSEFSALPQAKVTLLFPCDPRFPTQSSSLRSSLLAQAAPGFSSPATDLKKVPEGNSPGHHFHIFVGLLVLKKKTGLGGIRERKEGNEQQFSNLHTPLRAELNHILEEIKPC